MRSRVQRAPGLPCALLFSEGANELVRLGRRASREREIMSRRHCERSEAIQRHKEELDCFVASAPALTTRSGCLKIETVPRSALTFPRPLWERVARIEDTRRVRGTGLTFCGDPSSAFAPRRHLLPQGEKKNFTARWLASPSCSDETGSNTPPYRPSSEPSSRSSSAAWSRRNRRFARSRCEQRCPC